MDENKWIDYELNGYDHLKGRNTNEIKNILPQYRLGSFAFYGIDNQPIIMDTETSQIMFIQPIIVGSVEFENLHELTITSATWIDSFNNLQRQYNTSRYPVYKAILSSNSISKLKYGIRNLMNF